MMFRKDLERRCSYCRFGAPAGDGIIICRKKGILPESAHCRRFKYDPLRRTPPRQAQVDFAKYDGKDYSL